MPVQNARDLGGKPQVVVFRNNGESVWMDFVDAKRVVTQLPAEWSKSPFGGQAYAAPSDAWQDRVVRGEASPIQIPLPW